MDEEAREAALCAALSNKDSAYYKEMCKLLNNAVAIHRSARAAAAYTTIPFAVDDADLVALETQFSVVLKAKGCSMRGRHTPRVAGLLFVLEAALLEHAGSGGRSTLFIDGDLMSMAAVGLESRIVERTHCHARAAFGYFQEDECLRRISGCKRRDTWRGNVLTLLDELESMGGEHYFPKVRVDGPKVDSVIINHFKTPVGLAQAAWLVHLRGTVGYGAFPFQLDMRVADEGELLCFPGRFYICRKTDMITLVPAADATMSISHPYSQLMEFVDNNGVVVNGREFLCEKYMSVRGILYYTLAPVVGDYEIPETLRAYYYDTAAADVSVLRYPKARLSGEGVPIGFERGEVKILKSRLEKVLARVSISRADIVHPHEVYRALTDYNSMVLNTLDSAVPAERMDELQQEEAALAIALHVNWLRHAARGTLNTLLAAVRMRFEAKDSNIMKLGFLALSAWWHRPTIRGDAVENVIPSPEVVDWCGNDFSVVVENVNPWIEVVQDTSEAVQEKAVQHPWLPLIPSETSLWWKKFRPLPSPVAQVVQVNSAVPIHRRLIQPARVLSGQVSTVVTTSKTWEESKVGKGDLTSVKSRLFMKLVAEQGSVSEVNTGMDLSVFVSGNPGSVPKVDVPLVDPVSAIRADLNDILGGLPDRDMVTTGFRLAEVEVDKVTRGSIAINDAKRLVPRGRYVRRPRVDAGVEGLRVPSQAALSGALFKRNIGIPSNRGFVDLELTPDANVKRVMSVCFREDWREVVNRHLETGMWQSNAEDVHDFLSGLDEKKVDRMLKEFFLEGYVALDEWHLMAKGKIKTAREQNTESRVDHSQTIMFLESSCTNGLYSSIMRRVNLCIQECLRENIRLNPQWSAQESEDWYNSMEDIRRSAGQTYSYSVDSSAFDRSQEHPALRTELAFYRAMGLGRETYEKWIEMHGKKRAMSMAFGIVISVVLCGVSGNWKTLLRNGLIQLAATVVSADLRRDDIVTLEVKGDDVDGEFRRPVKVETAVERMSLSFNLSSKFQTNDVRYFCKNFRLKILGRWVEVADPWARVQSLCTPVWVDNPNVNMAERWVSLRADLRHYDNALVLYAVAEATQKLYGLKEAPYGMCMALSRMVADKNAYMAFFHPPELVD